MKKTLKLILIVLFGIIAIFVVVQSTESNDLHMVDYDLSPSERDKAKFQVNTQSYVQENTSNEQNLPLSDRDGVEVAKVISIIEACLDQRKLAEECVGVYAFTCTTTNCANFEIDAWSDLMKKYLNTLYKTDELSESLQVSQKSWEKYYSDECLFIHNYWINNRIIGNSATRTCSLNFVSERALKLREHVVNLNQRLGDF